MTRRLSIALLFISLVFAALSGYGTAQSRRAPTGLQAAVRALNEGRFDEVIALADKLDGRDPNVVAVKARADIARGRYGEAEALLRPVASRLPTSDAALELGLLLKMLSRSDATAILQRVATLIETSQEPYEVARAGRALRALGRFQEANAAYRDATLEVPGDPALQTAWGELFLEKYNKAEAMRSFQMALQADARWTPAIMGSARALADDNPPQAVALAKHALEINPSSVDAYVFLAGESADALKNDEARQSLAKALEINPSSLDAHAMLAAVAYVQDKQNEFEAEVARALTISPGYADAYRVPGELTAHNYRFDEAVALTRRALVLDSRNPRTLGDLGMHLLRTGDEAAARAALDESFKIDPYDVVTFNLLAMMDTLDKFVTVRDGDIVMRMARDESPVLQEYAMPLAKQALATLSKWYAFTPRGPILIEIFTKHDDFAVRNLGLPGMIGALGACFGRVVTMDSPKARPPGEFQWEETLWHELAHVVTLQMSGNRLPRWLSEGISGFEEKRARPEWGREMDLEFATLLNRDGAIKLKDLNAAFQSPRTISYAYFQAALLVEHIVKEFGDDALRKVVRAYAQPGQIDPLKNALNIDLEQMQAGFDQTIEKQYGELRRAMAMPEGVDDISRLPTAMLRELAAKNPRSFPVQMMLGRALRKEGQLDEAIQAYERAAALVPTARGKGSPHAEIAAIAIERKDPARAITALTALIGADSANVEAARQLTDLLRQADVNDPAKLQPIYQRIASVDPFDAQAHAMLGRFALDRNEPEVAAREFRAVIALNPVDRAAAHTDLAESYYKSGKRAEAKKQTLAALEIAPTYQRAQELLLKLVDGK